MRKNTLTLLAPAKLNLFLEVINRRKDNYHNLETVMQKVDIFDTIQMTKAKGWLSVTANNSLPTDKRNTVVKALEILRKRHKFQDGLNVKITKKIPIAGGFGGGSSDAASALIGANKILGLKLAKKELNEIAKKVGADVPFFLGSSTALCVGRGDVIKKSIKTRQMHYVVVMPRVHNLTKEIYENLSLSLTEPRTKSSIFCKYLRGNSIENLGRHLFNRLEEPAFRMKPELSRIKRTMQGIGFCGVSMTGSGSAIYGLCKSRKEAMQKAKLVRRQKLGKVLVLASLTS